MPTSACEAVVVSLSDDGHTCWPRVKARPMRVPAYPVKVRDVSGAGDTVSPFSA